MIGGDDFTLEGPPWPKERFFILKAFYELWSNGVWHGVDEVSATYPLSGYESASERKEFFVYENQAMFESWEQNGLNSQNENSMTHVILGDSSITIVVDDRKSELGEYVHDLIMALYHARAMGPD